MMHYQAGSGDSMSDSSLPADKHELRTDFLGRSVVLAPSRSARPHDFEPHVPAKKSDAASCYFCPRNEHTTPPEIERVGLDGAFRAPPARGSPQTSEWRARVFPNAYPAFSKTFSKAYGVHEVVVETPDHSKTLSQLDEAGFSRWLGLLARRLRAHEKDRKLKYTVIFKNEWAAAGASLEHTHTQLVGMGLVPATIKREQKLCKSSCPFCLLSVDDKFLKIIEDGPFLAMAPYAPRFNHEVWVVPRAHTASLVDLDETAITALGRTVRSILRAQDACLNYPAYNLIFHVAPLREKNFHFHIEICPRIGQWAGFEMGFDMQMNSVRPEETATLYKDWLRANP
ncbi:Uncharacterised protein [uncultured archaeon]|nr:Uncharacterised protein [uncultured archaeon]